MALQVVVNGVTVTTDCANEMVNFLALYNKSQPVTEELPSRAQLLEQLGVAALSEPARSPHARRNAARRSRRAKQRRAAKPTEASAPVEAFVEWMGPVGVTDKKPRRTKEERTVVEGQVWKAAYGRNTDREIVIKYVKGGLAWPEVLVPGTKTGRSYAKPIRVELLVKSYRLQ